MLRGLVLELLVTVGDSPSSQVVSRNLYLNAVSGKNANVMFSHFAAQVTKNFMSIIQLDAEVPTFERFNRLALKQDGVVLLFRQTKFPSIAVSTVYRSNLTHEEICKTVQIQLFWTYSTQGDRNVLRPQNYGWHHR